MAEQNLTEQQLLALAEKRGIKISKPQLTEEQLLALANKRGINVGEKNQSASDFFFKPKDDLITAEEAQQNIQRTSRGLESTLPDLGAITGGVLGAPGGPLASILMAGAGRSVGRVFKEGLAERRGEPTLPISEAPQELSKEFAFGAGGEGIGLGAGKLLSKAAQPVADKLRDVAVKSGMKSMRARQGDVLKLMNRRDIDEVVLEGMDMGLVKIGDDAASIASRAELKKDEVGKKIGEIIDKANAANVDTGIDPETLATELLVKFGDEFKGLPGSDEALNKLAKTLQEFADNGSSINLKQLHKARVGLDRQIKNFETVGAGDLFAGAQREIRERLNEGIRQGVANFPENAPVKLIDEFTKANREFGVASDILKLSEPNLARQFTNRGISLSDTLLGLGGLGIGSLSEDPVQALVFGATAGLGNNILRRFGRAALGRIAQKATATLEQSPINRKLITSGSQEGKTLIRDAILKAAGQEASGKIREEIEGGQ